MNKKIILIPVLIFLLTITFPLDIYASSNLQNVEDATGYNEWDFLDKVSYWSNNLAQCVGSWLGVSTPLSMDELYLRNYYPDYVTDGCESVEEFFASHVSYDDTSQSFIADDSAMDFINFVKVEAEEQITYQYAYFPNSNNLKASDFNTLNCYSLIKAVIEKYPNKLFRIVPYYNNVYTDSEGVTHQGNGYQIYAFDMPYAGVCEYLDLASAPTTFYTEDWNAQFTYTEFFAFDVLNSDELDYMFGKNSEGVWTEWFSVEDLETFDFELCSGFTGTNAIADKVAFSRKWYNGGLTYPVCVTNYTGAVPVFKSLADLKNGTAGGTCGQMMPNYSPGTITDNSITTSEVNEYVTNYNYYYGTGGGSDGSGDGSGGSSSGNWLDTLLNGIGNIGDAILAIVSKLIEILSKIFTFFTDTLLEAIDIIPTNFIEFLSAFFPFIPEEWITAVSLLLCLVVIGVFIKLFK